MLGFLDQLKETFSGRGSKCDLLLVHFECQVFNKRKKIPSINTPTRKYTTGYDVRLMMLWHRKRKIMYERTYMLCEL